MSMLTKAFKGIRKTLHLPPLTIGNTITKYGPAAVMAATGNLPGAAATMYGVPTNANPRSISIPGFQNPVSLPGGGGGDAGGGGGGGWGDILGSITGAIGKGVDYAKDNPLNVALGGLAVAQGVNAAKASARSGKLSDEAIAMAKQRWASQQGLRDKSIAGLMNPPKSNLSAVYTDPFNPFATPTRPAAPTPAGPIASAPAAGIPPNRLPSGAAPGLLTHGLVPLKRRLAPPK